MSDPQTQQLKKPKTLRPPATGNGQPPTQSQSPEEPSAGTTPSESVAPPASPPDSDILSSLRKRFGGVRAGPPSRTRMLKMLTYGDAGVGKTTFAGSSQGVKGFGDVLDLDIEGGSMSLAHNQAIDRVFIDSYAQFARMADWARLYGKAREMRDKRKMILLEQAIKPDADPDAVAAKPKNYKTLIIDSLSEAQKLCMYQLMGVDIATKALDEEPDSVEFKQWGQASEMIRLLVRTFRSLPFNVFFVCGLATEQDERKRIHHLPALPGKLAKEIHGFVDVVGYMAARQRAADNDIVIERRMYLQPGETFQAKDRYHTGNSVRYLVNPTVESFLEAEGQESPDSQQE